MFQLGEKLNQNQSLLTMITKRNPWEITNNVIRAKRNKYQITYLQIKSDVVIKTDLTDIYKF